MQALMIVFVGGAILLTGLAVPMWLGCLRPNSWYGFRVGQTLKDPLLWNAVNRYSGKRLFITGLVSLFAGLGLPFWPGISADGYALAYSAVFGSVFLVTIIQSLRYLKSQAGILRKQD